MGNLSVQMCTADGLLIHVMPDSDTDIDLHSVGVEICLANLDKDQNFL